MNLRKERVSLAMRPRLNEKHIVNHILDNNNIYYFVIITVLSLLYRYVGLSMVSNDMSSFLIPWFNSIKAMGGLDGLTQQIGNYNLLYQTIIAILSYIPVNCVLLYKGLSITFDYILALIIAIILVKESDPEDRNLIFLKTYTVMIFLPTIVLNSSFWGQCDSIYTVFVIIALASLYSKKNIVAFVTFGIAIAFKLQAIFLLPFVLFVYFCKKSFSFFCFIITLITFIATGFIGYLKGRSMIDPIVIYLDQTNTYESMFLNVHSFWMMLGNDYLYLKSFAIIFTISILGYMLFVLLNRRVSLNSFEAYYGYAAWVIWTCVLFLPAMHERYTYALDVLLVIMAMYKPAYIKYAFVSVLLSLYTYGVYLFNVGEVNVMGSLLYTAMWGYYTYEINKNSCA